MGRESTKSMQLIIIVNIIIGDPKSRWLINNSTFSQHSPFNPTIHYALVEPMRENKIPQQMTTENIDNTIPQQMTYGNKENTKPQQMTYPNIKTEKIVLKSTLIKTHLLKLKLTL